MSTRCTCLMPQGHLGCHNWLMNVFTEIEKCSMLLLWPQLNFQLTPASAQPQHRTLLCLCEHARQPHRHPSQKLEWQFSPPCSSPGTASTAPWASCLQSSSTSTRFPKHSPGNVSKTSDLAPPAYTGSVAWSLWKTSNSFRWFMGPALAYLPVLFSTTAPSQLK